MLKGRLLAYMTSCCWTATAGARLLATALTLGVLATWTEATTIWNISCECQGPVAFKVMGCFHKFFTPVNDGSKLNLDLLWILKGCNQLLPGCCTNIVISLWEELLHHQTGAIAGGRLPICSTTLLQSKKSLLFHFPSSFAWRLWEKNPWSRW